MEQDFKSKVDQACRTAEDFTKHYYESVDRRRHVYAGHDYIQHVQYRHIPADAEHGMLPHKVFSAAQFTVPCAGTVYRNTPPQVPNVSKQLTFQLLSRYYLDTAVLVWNGNGTVGKEQIQKFFEDLPTSQHTLTSLDSQPVLGAVVANQLTFLMQVGGFVKFQERASRPFQQNFMITAEGDKWKIVSDCFRLQEPVGEGE